MKIKVAIGTMMFLFMSLSPIQADSDIPSILKSIDSVELKYDEKQLVRGERFAPWDWAGAKRWIKEHGGTYWIMNATWHGIYILDPNSWSSYRVASY